MRAVAVLWLVLWLCCDCTGTDPNDVLCVYAVRAVCVVHAAGLSSVSRQAPAGPYTFTGMAQAPASALPPKTGGQGDYALFLDTDGAGYIILTHLIAGAGHRDMLVLKLKPDFLVRISTHPQPSQPAYLNLVVVGL